MPIRKYIDGGITPEVAKAMCEAFGIACRTLEERGLDNISTQGIAAKISALAHTGVEDAKQLAEAVLAEILPEKKAS